MGPVIVQERRHPLSSESAGTLRPTSVNKSRCPSMQGIAPQSATGAAQPLNHGRAWSHQRHRLGLASSNRSTWHRSTADRLTGHRAPFRYPFPSCATIAADIAGTFCQTMPHARCARLACPVRCRCGDHDAPGAGAMAGRGAALHRAATAPRCAAAKAPGGRFFSDLGPPRGRRSARFERFSPRFFACFRLEELSPTP